MKHVNMIVKNIICAKTLPMNMTNTVSTNVASTISTNSDGEKVRYKMDSYILYTVLLVIKLIFIIVIIFYYYTKHSKSQKKDASAHYQYEMKNNKLKDVCIKIRTFYYFAKIIKIEDFDFDNILVLIWVSFLGCSFCSGWKTPLSNTR